MPEWLTRGETPQSIAGRVAGFQSEWWPTSNRNGGRLRLGSLAGFNRNPHQMYATSSAGLLGGASLPVRRHEREGRAE